MKNTQSLRQHCSSRRATGAGRCFARAMISTSLLCALAVAIVPAKGVAQTGASTEVSLAEILDRAGAYVRQFEQDFTMVVSDETYEQRVRWELVRGGYPGPAKRRLRSEMFFMWLPEEQAWLSVRNVMEVDGQDVPDAKQRLDGLLQHTGAERVERFRMLLDEGARFNIGTVHRNFADTTLALQFLDPVYRDRFTFSIAGRATIEGATVAKLEFTEHKLPTVITSQGVDVLSQGSLWVRPADGAILRTRLAIAIPNGPLPTNLAVELMVDFSHDQKLGMLVPSRMEEQYVQTNLSMIERIDCVATYSNFRRFETSGRVISLQP